MPERFASPSNILVDDVVSKGPGAGGHSRRVADLGLQGAPGILGLRRPTERLPTSLPERHLVPLLSRYLPGLGTGDVRHIYGGIRQTSVPGRYITPSTVRSGLWWVFPKRAVASKLVANNARRRARSAALSGRRRSGPIKESMTAPKFLTIACALLLSGPCLAQGENRGGSAADRVETAPAECPDASIPDCKPGQVTERETFALEGTRLICHRYSECRSYWETKAPEVADPCEECPEECRRDLLDRLAECGCDEYDEYDDYDDYHH